MAELPSIAAWRHLDARDGSEVVFISPQADGYRLEGYTTAVEAGGAWSIRYEIELDSNWTTHAARAVSHWAEGRVEVALEADGSGSWRLGEPAGRVDGCLDVDLEASAFTNALPVHRLGLKVGESAEAPAAYLRAPDLRLERLEQRYVRLDDDAGRSRYDYAAPEMDFSCVIVYDEHGLVLDYPGIAVRIT